MAVSAASLLSQPLRDVAGHAQLSADENQRTAARAVHRGRSTSISAGASAVPVAQSSKAQGGGGDVAAVVAAVSAVAEVALTCAQQTHILALAVRQRGIRNWRREVSHHGRLRSL